MVRVDDTCGAVDLELTVTSGGPGAGRQIDVSLRWDPADPLEVVITVSARPDHPALPRGRWVLLRDFLRYGLDEPTGDGAVRVLPNPPTGSVEFELARAGRPCLVAVPIPLVAAFLSFTERTVPFGEERSDADVEAFIAKLLQT